MKKLFTVLVVCIFISCNNSSGNQAQESMNDSASLTNSGIDTLNHPSGVDNSAAISTDTAAINVQNTLKKADSIANKKINE